MALYPDQLDSKREIYNAWREGHKRVLFGASTGSGKTVIAVDIIRDAIRKKRIPIFIVDRIGLVYQTANYLQQFGLNVSIYQGANTFRHINQQVVVASIQTLARRNRFPDIDLIIIDECHVLYKTHEILMNTYDNVLTLGLSATPLRKKLGQYFTKLVRAPSTQTLINMGRLVPFVCYGPSHWDLEQVKKTAGDFNQKQLGKAVNQKTLIAELVETWQKLGEERPTFCFAVDIAHSKNIVARFNYHGIPAEHIDTYTPDDQRYQSLKNLRERKTKILSSVGILSIGIDEPIVSCIIGARPTHSLMLFIQQVGRGARVYQGKDNVIILDHAGNCERLNLLPQDFVIPELNSDNDKEKKRRDRKASKPLPCERCSFLMMSDVCPQCGWQRQKLPKIKTVNGELVLLKGARKKKQFLRELIYLCLEENKKIGLAYYLYKRHYKEEPPLNISCCTPDIPSDETRAWYKQQQINYARRKSYANRKTG
jgi:DNA repair protein RadD